MRILATKIRRSLVGHFPSFLPFEGHPSNKYALCVSTDNQSDSIHSAWWSRRLPDRMQMNTQDLQGPRRCARSVSDES